MAGRVFFKKAEPMKGFVKMSIFGPSGVGKTFTALLLMEGLARVYGKRFAFIDTERGTDFYALPVPTRKVHPDAFDFDAEYTRSIVDLVQMSEALDQRTHCGLVVDSMTHFWEAAVKAYRGPWLPDGRIPPHAWGPIKAPYRRFMNWVVNSPFHVIICGREANAFDTDDDGKMVGAGKKMRAEGETAYEPDICLRLVQERVKPAAKGMKATTQPAVIVEKDRSGVLQGQQISMPSFDNVIAPILPLLGLKHAAIPDEDEATQRDVEGLAQQEREKARRSEELLTEFRSRMNLVKDRAGLDALQPEIAKAKKQMLAEHVAQLRDHWLSVSDKYPAAPKAAKAKKEAAEPTEPAEGDPAVNGSDHNAQAPGE